MSTIGWLAGRTVTLTIPNGGTTTDVLDLGAVSSFQGTGIAIAAGSTTTNIPTGALFPTPLVADFFKGKFVVFRPDTTTAALRDQIRLITASTVGGAFTVTALTDAAVAGDVFDIVNAPAAGARSYRRWDVMIHNAPVITTGAAPQLSPYEAGTFQTLQSGGADIALTAGKVTPIIPLVGRYFRILGSAQGQITRFTIVGVSITNER